MYQAKTKQTSKKTDNIKAYTYILSSSEGEEPWQHSLLEQRNLN